jgi:hypothetical protein
MTCSSTRCSPVAHAPFLPEQNVSQRAYRTTLHPKARDPTSPNHLSAERKKCWLVIQEVRFN